MDCVNRVAFRCLVLALVVLISAGCAQTLPGRCLMAQTNRACPRAELELVAFEEQATDRLQELLNLAVKHHPDLRVAHARVEAARGRMIQAGLYPNPAIGSHFTQLGDSTNRLGQPGARVIQTIVTGGKLRIAKAAAAHGIEAADWQAITRWHDVVARVRFAYFESLVAQAEQQTMNEIVRISTEALATATSLDKAGAGTRTDVLRAKVELEQNRLKREVSLRRVEAARQSLWTSLGRHPTTLRLIDPPQRELEQSPPVYEWNTLLECLHENSAELHEAQALVAQQEKLLVRAQKEVRPNITVTATPSYESTRREMRAEITVTAPIPIFDRNQGNIHTAQADLARTRAEVQQLELRLTERLINAYQRYQSARQQTESYHKTIVPDARESLKLVETGYRAGDRKYDYTAVLQAQQVLFQAQLAHTQALGELWRSVIEIANILQQDDLRGRCAVRERR